MSALFCLLRTTGKIKQDKPRHLADSFHCQNFR
jgi:hypothetical protein